MKVAFIGLGSMGMPMAANIAAAGHELTVWNRSRKTLEGFDQEPRWADSPAAAARGAEAVVSMLADDAAAESVVADGLLDGLEQGAVHVSASTLSLETLGEAVALMRRGGVDPAGFIEAVNSLFASPVYANYGAAIAEGRHEPGLFKLRLGLKDARLALMAGDELGVPMPLASLTHDTLLQGLAQGRGDQDWSAMAAVAQSRAGL